MRGRDFREGAGGTSGERRRWVRDEGRPWAPGPRVPPARPPPPPPAPGTRPGGAPGPPRARVTRGDPPLPTCALPVHTHPGHGPRCPPYTHPTRCGYRPECPRTPPRAQPAVPPIHPPHTPWVQPPVHPGAPRRAPQQHPRRGARQGGGAAVLAWETFPPGTQTLPSLPCHISQIPQRGPELPHRGGSLSPVGVTWAKGQRPHPSDPHSVLTRLQQSARLAAPCLL